MDSAMDSASRTFLNDEIKTYKLIPSELVFSVDYFPQIRSRNNKW